MATARQLHPLGATIDITISPSGTVSDTQGFLQVTDSTDIEWDNTGSVQYDIVFTIGNLPTLAAPARGTAGPITGSEIAVNYVIKNHNTGVQTGGPYAIQWGNGVLAISVTASSPPFTVAVPANVGNIQFTTDAAYNIAWADGNGKSVTVWSKQPASISPTPVGGSNPNPVQQAKPGATTPVNCTFSIHLDVPGKGTVKIGSAT
jgi:hypothetical protein